MTTDTMEIWKAVAITDPKYTKVVKQRGGFTSICAQYQVQKATKLWGPMGKDWDVEVQYRELSPIKETTLVVAEVSIRYPGGRVAAIRAGEWLVDVKGRVDLDAWKKSRTDAMTKALSQLGFSADVFLGLFDDNRYVQWAAEETRRRKKEGATPPAAEEPKEEALLEVEFSGAPDQRKPAGTGPIVKRIREISHGLDRAGQERVAAAISRAKGDADLLGQLEGWVKSQLPKRVDYPNGNPEPLAEAPRATAQAPA